ncbi:MULTISPECIES: RNA polymerase sigma factor SigF [Streptomyces]|uniref:RNA polymerase sigma factor SigB n=1 Tax=Streptomyces venezuelae (strain ATCC 10712 / CBS 650.69 / DSM 40230 / JCM 4526 / NBRC 13096 / PD 04745) TaxID=953739 RepID=F2R5K6_STRVP|nr:RNA polymerase sigma factor SigF [Streptomyces venezuelae]APE19730.1 RNA polymerase subunit sigma [Streptomyces venezuelae]CCA53517.1 RNA polymerase sigma factor SigB [Streptomyces venezuelae ATCC 10712]
MRTEPAQATTTHATNGTGEELPVLEAPHELPPKDARALSKVFLRELAAREEGTEGHQYVRNTLIEMNMSLVVYAAGRFRARGDEMEDIVQVGMIGLIKAIDRFDLSREVEFATFAVPYIVGEIKRFFRDSTWAVHVPRRLQEARVELAKATDELSSRLGRAPRVAELAPAMDLSEEQVVEAQVAANGYHSTSLDAAVAGGDSEDDDAALADLIGQEDPAIELFEDFHTLAPLVEALGPRDRLLLHLRFVEELTQSEIGERLGVSQMHVSRLLARNIERLRAGMVETGTDD